MAKSNIPGIYGYAKGKVGAVVYSTSSAALDGQTRQTIRLKPTSVRNPNTMAQIIQRMKIGPAQLFYSAFEKAASSVENNPLSHSFEGTPYGTKTRSRFIQLALQGDPKAYVPKGITSAAPGIYQVSEGSLPSLPSGVATAEANQICFVNQIFDAAAIASLAEIGVEQGDQLTCVGLLSKAGNYSAVFARTIVKVGNAWEFVNADSEGLTDLRLKVDGIDFEDAPDISCAAFIVSRGINTSNAKRSTAIMTLAPSFANLMSADAFEAAVDSYMNNVVYNTLNSEWYLNQGNKQAFNGTVKLVDAIVNGSESWQETDDSFLVGMQASGSNIVYTVVTTDGTASGQVYSKAPGMDAKAIQLAVYERDGGTSAPITGAQLAAGLAAAGLSTNGYVKFTNALAAQGGFTLGE